MTTTEYTKQNLDFDIALKLLNQISSFGCYSADYSDNNYVLEINDKELNRYVFTFNKKRITTFDNTNKLSDTHNVSSAFTGVIEFSKKFSDLTGDYEDYEIMIDRLEGLLYR